VFVDLNALLKLKFHGMHSTVVNNINPAGIIDFLFQEKVLGAEDTRTLHQKNDPQKQCRDLLMLLHTSDNPQTFVILYRAIKNESHLHWLVDLIDEYSDQSVIDEQLQQRYISSKTGEYQSNPLVHSHGCFVADNCTPCGPADATATRSSLTPVKSRIVSGAGLPRLSWKIAIKRM